LKLNVPRIGVENEGLREVNESKTSAIHMCFVRLQVYLLKSIAEKAIDRVKPQLVAQWRSQKAIPPEIK
jgi:hypothetical protein